MKYKDYYAILGVKNDATADEIKTAYRRLARKYHPDVSKEKDAEEKFKEMGEAYETLKDPEKRAAYDQLGSHTPGQDFRPPPDWGREFAQGQGGFDDIDLSDLFAGLAGRQARRRQRRRAGAPTIRWPAATTKRSCACRSSRRSTARRSTSSSRRSNGRPTAACAACRTA